MYLAIVKREDGIPEAETRLRIAINELKDTSKLKALCKELLEKTKVR